MTEDDVVEKIHRTRSLAVLLAVVFIALLAGFFFIPGVLSSLIRGHSAEYGFLVFFGVPLALWVIYELVFAALIRCPSCNGRLSEGYLSAAQVNGGTLRKSSCVHCHVNFESK